MDSNATLTGAHDVQTLQARLFAIKEGQDRCTGRISRLHRKMNAIAEKVVILNGEMLALTAEMAHFCETNPVAARSADGTETILPPRAGPFQTGGDAAPSGRAATGDAPPAQNDAKVVVADGESHSMEGLSDPMSACGTHKPFGTTTGTTAVVGSDPSAGKSRRAVRATSTPLECSSSAYDGGRSSDGLPIWNDRAWISGGAPTTRTHRSSWSFVARHATSIARIGEGAVRGMASHREPCATTGMLTRVFLLHSALICSRTYQLQIQRHLKRGHRAVSASYCHAVAFRSASSIAHTPTDRLKLVDMGETHDG